MKIKIAGILLLACNLAIHAQNTPVKDDYIKAKEIVTDLNKIVSPNGIQENFQANIGGVKQWIFTRGQDKKNPIILFVHGGPASPLSPVMWTYQRPMEEYFTMVTYDQRASGKTYASNDTTRLDTSIHINRYVDDLIAIAQLVAKKYNKRKLILAGHSWGTIISMKAALKRPDLFYAYVGIGQVINTMRNEELSFNFGLAQAIKHQNQQAVMELKSIAPYPGNTPVTRERIIIARKWPQYYGGLSAYRNNSSYFFSAPLLSPEYTRQEVIAIDKGSLYTLDKVLPEFLKVDFDNILSFPIPVFMFMGRHDYTTPSASTAQWMNKVKAPVKRAVWFENSAHLIPIEEPGKMLLSLVELVLPVVKD